MPTTPQDRKPKKGEGFRFFVRNKAYTIPPPDRNKVDGRALRDAILDGETGQLRFGIILLEACGAPQATLDALYSLPAPQMMEIVGKWMDDEASGADGVSLGKSSDSSD